MFGISWRGQSLRKLSRCLPRCDRLLSPLSFRFRLPLISRPLLSSVLRSPLALSCALFPSFTFFYVRLIFSLFCLSPESNLFLADICTVFSSAPLFLAIRFLFASSITWSDAEKENWSKEARKDYITQAPSGHRASEQYSSYMKAKVKIMKWKESAKGRYLSTVYVSRAILLWPN